MDSFDELRSEISKLVKWQSVIFCASCSERVTPIIRALARAELVQLWDDWLNQAWDEAIEGQESSLALLASIEATPESQYTDSHHSEYYVMRAIGVLWYALTAIGAADPSECAKWVSQSMESFASDFDVVISEQRRKEI